MKCFAFLLIAPRIVRNMKSRFYVYKMDEYKGPAGIAALRRDTVLTHSDEELASWIRHMGWLDWEHFVEFLYPLGNPRASWVSEYCEPLKEFLKLRRLWPFHASTSQLNSLSMTEG